MILHSLFKKLRNFLRCYTHKEYFKKITGFIKENKKTFLTVIVIAIFADVLFFKESSDSVIFGYLFLYAILVITAQIKSRFTFLLSLCLLGIMFVDFIISGTSIATEKAAVWFILFLGFGIIHQWKELKY